VGKGPEREWFTQLRVLLFAVVSWFALSIAGELIGNQANETAAGQTVGHYVLLVAIVVVPAFLLGWAVLSIRERRRARSPLAVDETPPPPRLFAPPTWHQAPELCDRKTEVWAAVKLVRANGVVAVVGARDVGTSAVGQAVAQELVDQHGVDVRATTRFDLRSRSASAPDDAVATAGRVVSAFGIDEPADETGEVLARVARELVGVFRASNGTLLLDNVTTPEQVAWLVREWPSGGPRLVVVGETALGDLVPHSTVEVGPMSLEDLRDLWRLERKPAAPPWFKRRPFAPKPEPDEELDELLKACFGRPRAVKAFAQEVGRPGSTVTLRDLLSELRKDGLVEGPLERVWRAILANLREGLSDDAAWLLSALAALPVTGLIKGAVAAMLGVSDDPVALEELRIRNLVEEVDGRYRLPQEIRRAIEGTTREEDRRAVAARAVPALLRFYRDFADLWSARLEVDPAGARAWFRLSEPSFRPLYGHTYLDDELLGAVLDDLCAIADALERWYARERLPSGLLAVSSGLYGLMERAGRADLAALAAIRMATAHRMARRFGEAAAQLDIARAHVEQLADGHLRSELSIREEAERVLLALDRGSGLPEPTELSAESPALLINRAVLCLAHGQTDEALEHLLRAEELAQDTGDVGGQAHSIELQGVVLSERNLAEAVRAWQLARATFARIGEEQGEARCLQHLGAAAVTDARAAGQLLRGNPEPVGAREAAEVALEHLERAKALRTGQPDTALVDHYLAVARSRLATP
jgi:tetratricopeptide (TPR) repeat protein